jgi:hypothetical protein
MASQWFQSSSNKPHPERGFLPLSLGAFTQEDGTALTLQASTTPGYAQLSDKEVVINIPVDATVEALSCSFATPLDLDPSENIEVHVLAGKSADNDELTLDCEVYPVAAGDTGNADIQDTVAQTITQAASELVFTCGSDGVLDPPGGLTVVLTLGGTNDGDATYIYAVWLEYTRSAYIHETDLYLCRTIVPFAHRLKNAYLVTQEVVLTGTVQVYLKQSDPGDGRGGAVVGQIKGTATDTDEALEAVTTTHTKEPFVLYPEDLGIAPAYREYFLVLTATNAADRIGEPQLLLEVESLGS